VGFHGLQALLWHVIYLGVVMAVVFVGVAFFIGGVANFAHAAQTAPPGHVEPPTGFLLGFGAFWLTVVAIGLVHLALQVGMAIAAGTGKWFRLPLIGGFALRHGPAAGAPPR
jgi:uncharacterized membrane protein